MGWIHIPTLEDLVEASLLRRLVPLPRRNHGAGNGAAAGRGGQRAQRSEDHLVK